jgi:hypothetical protein
MASATYLQSLDSVYEDGTSRGVTPSNRRQIETFIASDTIAQYDAVSFDFSKAADGDKTLYVVRGMIDATSNCCIGIAQTAAVAGDTVEVVIAGITEANVEGATVQGDRLYLNTIGQLAVYAAAITLPIVAHATEADVGNIATVIFLKQF